ncbi:unnamed protein product [Rotaria sp. Silwood1]|nr:unnamed protein product [Rotaria sp. Silwood1]
MAFLINPFLFFYYEEKEEQIETSKRIRSAIKWTIGFLIFLIILIILGIFVPQLATLPSDNSTSEWDHVKYLIDHFDSSRVEDSISFAIFTLSIIGFILLTIYTGYGSIACPISLIRGKRSARLQQATIEEQRIEIQNQIRILKTRYPRHVPMPANEKRKLAELEQQDAALCRNQESIITVRQSFCFKCRYIYRPIQIILGGFLCFLAILIFISLLLSNINKCINFVNFKQIFAQGNQTLPNPIDLVFIWTGKNGTIIVEPCTQFVTTDQCQMTVMGRIILRFFYKVWFFGAIYFCLSWLFLLIFAGSFILKLIRNRESNIHEYTVESVLENDDENEDEPLIE